jgi:hypothetical protein
MLFMKVPLFINLEISGSSYNHNVDQCEPASRLSGDYSLADCGIQWPDLLVLP